MNGRFVAYYRVSTRDQGESGLGLEAQRKAVASYLNGGSWELVGEFEEWESGKRSDNRPKLVEALAHCKLAKAKLVIAKLDRLSRNVHFLSGLMESGVEFVACDMPEANKLTLHIMAAMAEHEREMISARTKAGLATIKDKLAEGKEHVSRRSGRPVKALGGFRGHIPTAEASLAVRKAAADAFARSVQAEVTLMRANGASLARIADALNAKHYRTSRGANWTPTTVRRVLERLTAAAA